MPVIIKLTSILIIGVLLLMGITTDDTLQIHREINSDDQYFNEKTITIVKIGSSFEVEESYQIISKNFEKFQLITINDQSEFDIIEHLDSDYLIIIGHGTPSGLIFNDAEVSWSKLAHHYDLSKSREILNVICYSSALTEYLTRSKVFGYSGIADSVTAAYETLGYISLMRKDPNGIFYISMAIERMKLINDGVVQPHYLTWFPFPLMQQELLGTTHYGWFDLTPNRLMVGLSTSAVYDTQTVCIPIPEGCWYVTTYTPPYIYDRAGITGGYWRAMNKDSYEHSFDSDFLSASRYALYNWPGGDDDYRNYIREKPGWREGYKSTGAMLLSIFLVLGIVTSFTWMASALVSIINSALTYAAQFSSVAAAFVNSEEWGIFGGQIMNLLDWGTIIMSAITITFV